MSTDHTSAAVRSGWSLGRSLLSAGPAFSALAVAATGALFTDTASLGNNAFATGDVELTATATDAEIIAKAAMAPGDVETGSVTVTNAGSLELHGGEAAVCSGCGSTRAKKCVGSQRAAARGAAAMPDARRRRDSRDPRGKIAGCPVIQ